MSMFIVIFFVDNDVVTKLKDKFLTLEKIETNSLFTRLKTTNSLLDKIERYNSGEIHDYGAEDINKCLNDILGIRIVLNDEICYEELQSYLKEKYDNIRCIISNPKDSDYIAVHVYFGIGDNTNFRWELQIWDRVHQVSNEKSHYEYKQKYKIWENSTKIEEKESD